MKKTEKTKKTFLDGVKSGIKSLPTPKSYGQINKENPHEARLAATQNTRPYRVAGEKLRPKTYAERKFTEKEFIINVRSAYPFLSVFLGAGVAYAAAQLFFTPSDSFGYYFSTAAVVILALLVFGVLESLKINTARNYYETVPEKRRGLQGKSLALFVYFLLSAGVSGLGGYLINIAVNDQTAVIAQKYRVEADSVKNDIAAQIAILNLGISENQKRMQSAQKWTRYHAQKDLAELQRQKTELLKLKKNEVAQIETEKVAQINAADLVNRNKGFLLTLVVIVLEILYLQSFRYEYAVERKIRAENINNGVEDMETEIATVPAQPAHDPLQQIGLAVVENLLGGGEQFTPNPAKTGFTINAARNAARNTAHNRHENGTGGTKNQAFNAELNNDLSTEMNAARFAVLHHAIRNGVRDYRTLCSLGFNPNQVKAAIEKIDAENTTQSNQQNIF